MLKISSSKSGFTLIELLVAITLAGIVATAIFSLFMSQSRSFDVQERTVALHQGLRVAIEVMERDLHWAGYDPTFSDDFSISDVRCRNTGTNTAAACDTNATTNITPVARIESAVTFTAFDNDFDGANETFDYSIFDSAVNNIWDLARFAPDTGVSRQMLAEGVECLGLAYAFTNGSGGLELNPATGQPFWAIDTDNNNVLDRHLDTNNDGLINVDDNPAGVALPSLVEVDRIRAVKIWLLGRALQADLQYQAANVRYKVGNRIVVHPNDNIRRQLISTTVKLRNLEL